MQKLYKEIEQEKNVEMERLNANKKCSWRLVILFIAFSIILITDFLLPFINNPEQSYNDDNEEEEDYEKEESSLGLAIGVLLSIVITIVTNSYTIVRIYSATRRQYITGDFLYDKQINDMISLVKTIGEICGDAFALVYCNLYFWIVLDAQEGYAKPYFYQETYIPDYKIVSGISVYMIVKIVVIIVSIVGSLKFNNFFLFENDLAEYNLSSFGCKYDNDIELKKVLYEKRNIVNILNK